MSIFRPTTRTAADRAPFRSVLAAIVVAGLATIGVTAFAAPAAAEESVAVAVDGAAPAAGDPAVDVSDPAEAEPSDAVPGDTEPADPAAGQPAADATQPAPDDEAAAPPAGDSAAPAPEQRVAAVALLVPPGEDVVDKVEICHATASYQHPYVINEPAADGDVSGHADHVGPIFYPEIPKHTAWGDIIPPFWYDDGDETPAFFPGLNWDEEGQAIYENDCVIPTPTPELVIEPIGCVLYTGTGWLDFTIGPLQENVDYLVEVWNSDGDLVVDQSFTGETGTVGGSLPVPPGEYSVTLSQSIIEGEWEIIAEQSFTIGACPELGVTVTPGVCSTGDDGTATVLFAGLIEGEGYDFVIDGPGDYMVFGGFIASGPTEELVLGNLPPGSYVASIEWNSGDEESSVVSASVDFSVNPCPVVPTTPAAPVKPAVLAATGTDGVGGMLAGSMLLLGLGGAVLLAARRRAMAVRDVS